MITPTLVCENINYIGAFGTRIKLPIWLNAIIQSNIAFTKKDGATQPTPKLCAAIAVPVASPLGSPTLEVFVLLIISIADNAFHTHPHPQGLPRLSRPATAGRDRSFSRGRSRAWQGKAISRQHAETSRGSAVSAEGQTTKQRFPEGNQKKGQNTHHSY